MTLTKLWVVLGIYRVTVKTDADSFQPARLIGEVGEIPVQVAAAGYAMQHDDAAACASATRTCKMPLVIIGGLDGSVSCQQ